jgi:3-dehydroquinate dehydratase type I
MICISIVPGTNEEALALIARALPWADLVELRIDRIGEPDLPLLLHAGKERILVTNRRRDEGGFFAHCENRRMELLREAIDLGARYVDIEVRTGAAALGRLGKAIRAKKGKTKLIVSHHDLKGTPSRQTLMKRLKACRALGADIVKIVTLAQKVEDNLRVLDLIPQALGVGQDIIAFCLGAKGRLSRVAAPLLGSCMSYASLEEGAESAPGQLTAQDMKKILGILQAP